MSTVLDARFVKYPEDLEVDRNNPKFQLFVMKLSGRGGRIIPRRLQREIVDKVTMSELSQELEQRVERNENRENSIGIRDDS